jgi:hypothetical protein
MPTSFVPSGSGKIGSAAAITKPMIGEELAKRK